MEKKEIIDGLKDLIKDRESFITEGAPKSWKTDTDRIFEHDKQVLEEAINTIQAQQQEIEELKDQNDSLYDIEGFSDEFYVDKQNPRVEVEIIELTPEVFAEWD